jgi:hypothetical protein
MGLDPENTGFGVMDENTLDTYFNFSRKRWCSHATMMALGNFK